MPNFIGASRGGGDDLLDLEVLGHRVGEELLAHLAGGAAGALGVAGARLEHDVAADAHVRDVAEAERVQRAGHRLALRVEDALAGNDADLDAICGHAMVWCARECLTTARLTAAAP